MIMSTKIGIGTRAVRVGQLIAGARKHFTNGGQVLAFAGALANVDVDDAVAKLQKLVDNRAKTLAAQATAKAAVEAERAAMPDLVAFERAFEGLLRLMFGGDLAILVDFGLQPRKQPVPKTSVEKAVAVAKAKATRDARGTMGPKAKRKVKGNVTGVLVTTITTAPAPAPAASAPASAHAAADAGATTTRPKG
jgi:hypothetical protein